MFVVWFVSFAALTGRGDWNDLMNFVHAAPLVPRARDLKVAVPSFESGGRRATERCSPEIQAGHNEHPRYGLSDSTAVR